MIDFTDKELEILHQLSRKLERHLILSDLNRRNSFGTAGTTHIYQSLERKGIVRTSHDGDRLKNKHYWWYLTDTGSEIIKSMYELRKL